MKRNNSGAMTKNIKSYCMVLCAIAGILYLAIGIFPRLIVISGSQTLMQGLERIEIFAIAAALLIIAYLLYRSGKKGGVRKIIKTRYRGSVSGNSRLSKVLEENNMIIDNCMRQMDGPLNLDAYLRRSALLYEKVCECESLAPNISEYRELKRMVTDSFVKSLPARVRRANSEAKNARTEKGRYRQMLSIRHALENCSIPPDLHPAVQQQIDKLPAVQEFHEMQPDYVPDDYLMHSIRMDIIDEKMISEVWSKDENDRRHDHAAGEKTGDNAEENAEDKAGSRTGEAAQAEKADESSGDETADKADLPEDEPVTDEETGLEKEAVSEKEPDNQAEPDGGEEMPPSKGENGSAGKNTPQPSIFKEHSFTNRELRFFKSLVSSLESAGLDCEMLRLYKHDGNTYSVAYGQVSHVGRIRLEKDNNYMQYLDAEGETRELTNPSRNRCITTIGKWIAYIKHAGSDKADEQ